MKTCSCGKRFTRSEFLALPLPASGRDTMPDPDGDTREDLIMRNCDACGSTLALPRKQAVPHVAPGAWRWRP